jgi:hypothetical protein
MSFALSRSHALPKFSAYHLINRPISQTERDQLISSGKIIATMETVTMSPEGLSIGTLIANGEEAQLCQMLENSLPGEGKKYLEKLTKLCRSKY